MGGEKGSPTQPCLRDVAEFRPGLSDELRAVRAPQTTSHKPQTTNPPLTSEANPGPTHPQALLSGGIALLLTAPSVRVLRHAWPYSGSWKGSLGSVTLGNAMKCKDARRIARPSGERQVACTPHACGVQTFQMPGVGTPGGRRAGKDTSGDRQHGQWGLATRGLNPAQSTLSHC